MLNGCDLFKLANCYVDAIQDLSLDLTVCMVPHTKESSWDQSLQRHLAKEVSLTCLFNRKEIKDHGEGGNIIGAAPAGNVLIIDDVLSAGTAARESIKILENLNVIPKVFLVGLDRQEKGSGELSAKKTELEKDFGIHVSSIINSDGLIEYSNDNSKIFVPM